MAVRFTQADVRSAFGLLCEEAKRNGIDSTGWILEKPDMGYRLMGTNPDGGRVSLGFTSNFGHLGNTAAEAVATLNNMRSGMWAVRNMRQG